MTETLWRGLQRLLEGIMTPTDIQHRNEQYRKYAMSRNNLGRGCHYLFIRRDGRYEKSIESYDKNYLQETAVNWRKLGMIENYFIASVDFT